MANYGVTDSGFNKKSREEILSIMEESAQNYFGDDINLAENSPLGIILKLLSFVFALIWNTLEKLYNAFYINTATDQQLDDLVAYLGLTRQSAVKATGQVTFSGDPGTTIPSGTQVETDTDPSVVFETTEEVTLNSGSSTVGIVALETGFEGNVSSGTITVITNPIAGLDSVNNNSATSGGADRETDNQLRKRYKRSTDIAGGATASSIRANILEATDATACIVVENTDNTEDADGRPPKSFEAIVLGGADQEIAEAIFEKKSAGIEAFGDISITLTDESGLDKIVAFSRGTSVDIYVDVTVTSTSSYPSDGDTQVEDEIINYIGGTLSDGEAVEGLTLGEDVIYTRLIDVCFNVEGVQDVDLTVGITDNPSGTSNISIAVNEVSIADSTKVDVV